jgi:hypothetical protein
MNCYCNDEFLKGEELRNITFNEFKIIDWKKYISDRPEINLNNPLAIIN